MIEMITGNEPFLIDRYKKEIKKEILMPEFNLLTTDKFDKEELEFASMTSFWGTNKTIILETEKLLSNQDLEHYLEDPPNPNINLYIFAQEVDKRLSIYKWFNKKKNIKTINKMGDDLLERWILKNISNKGCKIKKTAFQEYIRRMNYSLEEVNLYHFESTLNQLCATDKEITIDLVEQLIPVNEKEDIFQLIQLIDDKNTEAVFHQIHLIVQNQENNIIGTLSLLLRSYRILLKMEAGFSLSELGVYYKTYLPNFTKSQVMKCIKVIQQKINGIKTGLYAPELALRFCIAELCQIK